MVKKFNDIKEHDFIFVIANETIYVEHVNTAYADDFNTTIVTYYCKYQIPSSCQLRTEIKLNNLWVFTTRNALIRRIHEDSISIQKIVLLSGGSYRDFRTASIVAALKKNCDVFKKHFTYPFPSKEYTMLKND